MKDFKEACEFFDIKTGKIYPVKGKNIYEIQIETKDDLCKFLVQIKPRKWKYRTEIIGLVLKSIRDPEKRAKIENELFEVYPDKKVHNTIKYKDFLRNLCEKYGYDVSIESIVKEVENALFYNENYKGLSNTQKKELNIYAKQIIDNLKRRLE
jgi:hypothetical protein